jgi:hypothetical protein
MLLFLMVAVAVLTITMLGVAANYRRMIMRDREVEMIHRGVQYARAVRRFYLKNGQYPISIEQLENTNRIRFLRKRYKDPMTKDGAWQMAHITDIKLQAPGLQGLTAIANGTAPATAASQASSSLLSSSSNTGTTNTGNTGTTNSSTGTGNSGSQTTDSNTATESSSDTSATGSANPASSDNVLGGGLGPMLGVISKSKAEGIHSFNDKSHYNEWYFIYDPTQEKGQQITGPWNPNFSTSTTNPLGSNGSNPTSPTNSPSTPANSTPTNTTPANTGP